jgi:hypothetical protein
VLLVGDPAPLAPAAAALSKGIWAGYKMSVLPDLREFSEQYGFLVMSQSFLDAAENRVPRQVNGLMMTAADECMLYAHCMFPIELLEGRVFLGNNGNVFSARHLSDLRIDVLLDLNYYEEGESKPTPAQGLYLNLPLHESLDIDFRELRELPPGRVLAFHRDWDKVVAFAVGLVMLFKSVDLHRASLLAFQRSGRDKPCKWLF